MSHKKSYCLFFVFSILITNTYGQESSKIHRFGLTASFSEAQFDVLFPIRLSETFTVSPSIGVVSIGESNTDFAISLAPKFYLNQSSVKPFIGLRYGVLVNSPKEGDSIIDYVYGPLAGGEYFFNDQLSIGIEAQLNFTKSDKKSLRFGNPGNTNINTATIIFASIYF